MNATADRLEFAPPPTPGLLRSLALAILAHAFLLAGLTWGLRWHNEVENITAEAELWSALPQAAAPKLEEVPPTPALPPPAAATPVAPPQPDAEIALAREKQRLKVRQEQERREELERQRQQKLKQEKLQLEKQRLQDRRDQERKALESKKALEDKRKAELTAQQEAKKLEQMRQENLKRITGLAGASGAAGASGTAQRASGPSASYAGRIVASIKPNIVFTEEIAGNPTAEVEVRAAPNGSILSRKLIKSSGVKDWDEAVIKAIDKTEMLPRDIDGRVPPSLIISFRPKD